MRSRLKVLYILLLAMAVCGSALAQTVSVTPTQVPKGAYVNGPGGAADDNYFFQQVKVTLAGALADNATITITLPTDMTIADSDGDAGYTDEVSLVINDGDAALVLFDAIAATSTTITLTADVAGAGATAAGDFVTVTFPVATELNPTVSSAGYAVTFSDVANNTSVLDTDASTQITYRNAGALQVINFADLLAGDNDSTSTYGEMYPATTNSPLTAVVLPNFIEDGGDAQTNSNLVTLDGADADEIVYTVWLSADSTLSHVSEVESGVLHAIDFDNGGNYTLNEGDRGNQAAETKGRLATSGLKEGKYYLYITSDRTGDFPLMRSGQLVVRHYPVVKIAGWDRAEPPNGFDNEGPGYDDDADLTLDTGDYVDVTGTEAGANGTATSANLYISVDDFDDNARVLLFYSTDSGLTVNDLVVSGPDTARVVGGLTGATALVDTLYENQEDLKGFIPWEWDVSISGSSYIPANSYTLYAVANDGKHQHLLKFGGAGNVSGLTIDVKHSPYLKLNSLAEYDGDGAAGQPFTIYLNETDTVMLSWGKQGVTGDADIDNSCIISFYIDDDDGADGVADHVSTDASGLESDAQLIVSGLEEDFDSKAASYYAWNIKAFADTTTWVPTAAAAYHLYAIIDENVTGGVRRVVALNTVTNGAGDDLDDIVDANDTPDNIQFNTGAFVRLYDPPVEGITVNGSDVYRMRFDAFDIDLAAELGIFVVPVGTAIGGVYGPASITAGDLGAGMYALTSTNGTLAGGATEWLIEGTDTYYDLAVRLPSEADSRYTTDLAAAATDLAAGQYWVYIGADNDNNDFADGTEVLYRAPGPITFRNIADTNDPAQNHLMMTPSLVSVAEGDTVTFQVRAADTDAGNTFVDLIDVYIAVEKDYFTLVNGTTPFTDTVPGAGVLIGNRVIDDTANNRWILNATAYNSSSPIALTDTDLGDALASFQLVAVGTENAIEANSAVYFVREPANGWLTKFSNDDAEVSISIGSQRVTEQPRGIVAGIVEFQGRNFSDLDVTFDLRERGSYANTSDTPIFSRNDGGIYGTTTKLDSSLYAGVSGIQYQLDTDGEFILKQVPPGEWDLVVSYNRYLSAKKEISVYAGLDTLYVNFGLLLGGDCIGYTDSSGVVWPNNRIDSDDISQISNAFLATPAADSVNWYAPNNWRWADINEDDIVNITDLTTATGNFTGADVDGAQPVYAKPAVEPVSNLNASVEFYNLPTEFKAGETYTIQVVARNTADVKGYFLNLGYDTAALHVVSVANGDLIDPASGFAFPVSRQGSIGLASSLYGDSKSSGNGVLGEFTFTAIQDGVFSADMLSITEASFVNSALVMETVVFNEPVVVDDMPALFDLSQNFPNPFNPTTTINFTVPETGLVKIRVYDILGRQVRTLVDADYAAGMHAVVWDARDDRGMDVSAGVYLYTIEAGSFHATKRMLLMK